MNDVQYHMIEQLYNDMFAMLYAYAFSALQHPAEAEEAIQDTFRIACCRAAELEAAENRNGWLVNTLKYVLCNHRRTRARMSRLLMRTILYEDELLQPDPAQDADNTVEEALSPQDLALVKYLFLEQHTMAEATEKFGLGMEACKKRVQRVRKKLGKKIFPAGMSPNTGDPDIYK